ENIKADKRLFMTATERLVRPWIVKKAEEYNRIVFSMDDEKAYGPVFHRFNFGEAIENEIISDYRIVIAGVKQSELTELIKANNWLVEKENSSDEHFTSGQNIFRQVLLLKAMQEFSMSKIITFHADIKKAKQFIYGVGSEEINLKMIFEKLWPSLNFDEVYLDHINGTMSAGERKERLDRFQSSKFGIISNARCLTEGVDVPVIDSVYFVNPKSSLIDIVQACGRALRKPRKANPSNGVLKQLVTALNKPLSTREKIAYFIIPILLPDESSSTNIVNEIDFEMLYNLIQSLRGQDQRLSEWIDKLNLEATKGKVSKFYKGTDSPIIFKLPQEFNISEFKENLYLKIAEVNADPTQHGYRTKK
ncbi:MAG: helicase-related protein, partial [Candidatus Daviesbacteria bacterium]|nr:helicase-related protein [Candidatus Daviesbacteria bacterium]